MAAPKVFIPFYSRTGTIEKLALAAAEGAKAAGAEVRLARARELVGPDIIGTVPGWKESAEAMNARYAAPTPDDAVWADAIIFGTPTRFGAVSSELKAYIDGLGGLWAQGKLNGKAGSVFAGSATPHGGNEVTSLSLYPVLAHLGLIIVPPGFADAAMFKGAGTPYGASHVAGIDGGNPIDDDERLLARVLGRRIAETAAKLECRA